MELDDNYFMKQALKLAMRAAEEGEVPIGAVVVADGHIIGKGYNQTERLNDATAHAEMLALTAAFQSLNSTILDECKLYVTIEPCVMCAGALKWARIGHLIFGASEPQSGFTQYSPNMLHPKTKIIEGVLADESGLIMTEFFRAQRTWLFQVDELNLSIICDKEELLLNGFLNNRLNLGLSGKAGL